MINRQKSGWTNATIKKNGLWYLEHKYEVCKIDTDTGGGLLPVGNQTKDIYDCTQTLYVADMINVDIQYLQYRISRYENGEKSEAYSDIDYAQDLSELNSLKECFLIVKNVALDRRRSELKQLSTPQKRKELQWGTALMAEYRIEAYKAGDKINLKDHRANPAKEMKYDDFFTVLAWIKRDLSYTKKRVNLPEGQNYNSLLSTSKRINYQIPMLEGCCQLIIRAINSHRPALTIEDLDAIIDCGDNSMM